MFNENIEELTEVFNKFIQQIGEQLIKGIEEILNDNKKKKTRRNDI